MVRTSVLLLLVVALLASTTHARKREYFIAAEEVEWDFAPTGINHFKEVPLADDPDSAVFFEETHTRIGGTYLKAIYVQYTDASFDVPAERPPEWEHLGFVGPPIYAEVGDTLEVHFRNNARYNFSIHAFGLSYAKSSEGAKYPHDGPDFPGNSVPPGGSFTYQWAVPARSGPTPHEWSSVCYPYTSHVDPVADTNSGLVGPIVVTAAGMADDDGRPIDVDREFFQLYTVTDENVSKYIEDNVELKLGNVSDDLLDDPDFQESNLMHGINGMLFSNLPGLVMTEGERVRWYTFSVGTEVDLHTAHWHGQTLLDQRLARVDVTTVFPGTVSTLDMIPDSPGIWFTHCHVNDHVAAGMMAVYEVLVQSGSASRTLANTKDPFSFLFSPQTVEADDDNDNYSSITNPFSSASREALTSCLLLLTVGALLL